MGPLELIETRIQDLVVHQGSGEGMQAFFGDRKVGLRGYSVQGAGFGV